ncbi:MAG: hypothetical protein NWF00_00660 [Candidatus Bathyarchaeota archaeon]|nr:hypothetical protein [Candidatus Bathyarchaeota archaeon]
MFKTPRNYLLLVLVLAFSFIFRVVLMLRETFPPGADIGLHNSVINSITQPGNTNFLYNSYHMGGGSSVTFPGYHIFTSYVIMLTGMPDFVAHAIVASLFSSLIVLVAFLITRKIWNVPAALIVAFLVAVSRFDLEMLMWGGYPNVITLMLIPLVFFLFLEKDRFSMTPFLVVTSLICGGIFLTHSLSSLMFVAITFCTVFFGVILARKIGEKRTNFIAWILPIIIGALIILPFLLQVAPGYLGSDAAAFTGGVTDIREALITTKILPLEIVVPLFVFVILFFLFSKYYMGKYLTLPTILLVLWWLIPSVLTQGYLIGLYTDYNRFLYFLLFPVIMMIGLGLSHCARFVAQATHWVVSVVKELPQVRLNNNKTLRRLLPHLERSNFLVIFIVVFLLYAFLAVPLFAPASEGISVQSFYQLMDQPEYDAIQWAKNNTPQDAIFLTDAQYGWWFGGFAQRPTISAVEPQYLTNIREFEPAKVARYVLDTDYLVDNGLIQVREDGGYIDRHNPEFLAKLNNSYFPYAFFNFNNDEITVTYRDAENNVHITDLSQIPVIDQHLENSSDYASIFVTQGNHFFNLTEKTTIYQGMTFANMTLSVSAVDPGITIDSVRLLLHTKGFFVADENKSSLAFVDPFMKVVGQLVFAGDLPTTKVFTVENPSSLEITYNLAGNSAGEINFYAGVYEYKANPSPESTEAEQEAFYEELVANHTRTYLNKISDAPLGIFDYRQALTAQNVSYIITRYPEHFPRLAKDPLFSLVFINNEVAIFQVHKLR